MADEAEVAFRTEQIATAVTRARSTMAAVADAMGPTGFVRVLERRLEDVESLRTGAGWVRENEADARLINADPRSEDVQRYQADESVRGAFRGVQNTAGVLVDRLNGARRELHELGEELAESAETLDRGLDHLDKLEELPGRQTPETGLLRVRLENLRGAVGVATESFERATARLESARSAASALETSVLQVDGSGQHSVLIDRTSSQLETDISVAREGMTSLSGQLHTVGHSAHEAAQQSIELADKGAELARTFQVGLNPQPAEPRQSSGMGEQDRKHMPTAPSPDKSLRL
ncbi:hypothetical protein AB0H36_31285 [Kribbella sp. NPDC050820]|uniref:hypothetical protein n=1 Tax=Kribbella sp. NPDC050820 TaxID=3155408 RepID=UPI0033D6AD8F